jgi:hypothetical protein
MPLPGLSLEDMRRLLRKGLGDLDDVDLPDTEADELLNLAFWELEDKFPFKEKELIDEDDTVAGTRGYALPEELSALISVSVKDPDDDIWYKLERMSIASYDESRSDREDTRARPVRYLRLEHNILFQPVPDQVYTYRVTMWRTLASLEAGVVEATGLPRNWDEMVVEGAIVRGHFYNQDYTEARQAGNFQIGKIRGAELAGSKEEKFDSRYARMTPVCDFPDGGAELPFVRSFDWRHGFIPDAIYDAFIRSRGR